MRVVGEGAAEFGEGLVGVAVGDEIGCPIGAGLGVIGILAEELGELTFGFGIVALLGLYDGVVIAELGIVWATGEGPGVCCGGFA